MKIYLSLFLLSICVVAVVSCSKEDDLDDIFHDLDVSSNVPLTKSSDPEGTDQHLGGPRWNDVPEEPNECVLNAFIRMAIKNKISLKIITDEGTETININSYGDQNSATNAYYKVRDYAMTHGVPMYDTNGIPQTDSSGNQVCKKYSGGAMTSSMALSLAKNIGLPILGRSFEYHSFKKLSEALNEMDLETLKGKCLICNITQSHACLFNGIDKKGRIIGLSAGDSEEKYSQEKNAEDEFMVIY